MYPKQLATVVLITLLFVHPAEASAMQGVIEKNRSGEIVDLINAYTELVKNQDFPAPPALPGPHSPAPPEPPGQVTSQQKDPEHEQLKTALRAYIIKFLDDENARTEDAKKVVRWSNISANTTFWIAHLFVIFGLAAASLEFRHARRLRSKGKQNTVEIEVSIEKIALRSSMYGVLMLFVSLVFYFLYLKFVYPVIVV